LGEHNCRAIAESDISSGFNDWMAHTRLLIAHEIYAGHSRAIYNKLKSVITDAFTRINAKYMQPYDIDICCHVLACSNSLNALSLDDTDRRWLVPSVTERKMSLDQSTSFYDWLSADGLGKIAGWARQYVAERGAVRAGEHAPMTTRKRDVIEAGMSEGQVIANGLATELANFPEKVIISVREAREWIASWRSLNVNDHRMEKQHTICKALRDGGLKEPALRSGRRPRFKIQGVLTPVVANFEIELGMEWEDLKASYKSMKEVQDLLKQVSTIQSEPPL